MNVSGYYIAILFTLSSVSGRASMPKGTKIFMVFDHIGNCPGAAGLDTDYLDWSVTKVGRDKILINGKIKIKRVLEGVSALAVLSKCEDRGLKTCEQFFRVPFKDICEVLEVKDQYWSGTVSTTRPPINCRSIKPDTYVVENGTMDLSLAHDIIKNIPNVHEYFWMMKFISMIKNKRVGCLYYTGKLEKIKA